VAPVIVDLIDDHPMYQGQWRKRLTYYKRCAYQIEHWKMGAEAGRVVARAAATATATQPQASTAGCLIADDDLEEGGSEEGGNSVAAAGGCLILDD
jgi:hypothetical protein